MGAKVGEEIPAVGYFNVTGLTDVAYEILKSTDLITWTSFASGTASEIDVAGVKKKAYLAKYTPDAAGFYVGLFNSPFAGKYVGLIYAVGKGQEVDILADTSELQVDWAEGGRLDSLLDAVALEATLAIVDGIVDDILVDTDEIQAALADGGFTDLLIDSIITYLSHGTYGLSALDTDLGTLLTRLSAVRAGYLDELDFALQEAIAAIPTTMVGTDDAALASSWTAVLATALGNYTAVRAVYLDQLDFNLQETITALQTDLDNPSQYMADVSALALEATVDDLVTRTKGLDDIHDDLANEITREAGVTTEDTWPHPSGTTEQTIFTLTITKRTAIHDVKIYTTNLTKSTAFRCFVKDNDGTYRQTPDGDFNWSIADPDLVWFKGLVHDRDVQFRMQSAEAEGASRDVPYSVIKEEMTA